MIGRSLIIFQFGNNKNELHEVNSWSMALSSFEDNPSKFNKKVIAEYKKKKWKPEAIVTDSEVEKIVNATNCIGPKEPGYHKWASDGVNVINLSNDPNLPNPATVKAEKRKREEEKRQAGFKRLKEFIPELIGLRDAVPVGDISLDMDLKVKVKVHYITTQPISTINVFDKNGREPGYASLLIDRKELVKRPELSSIVNCPHRKAYLNMCKDVANLVGLTWEDVENHTYFASRKG